MSDDPRSDPKKNHKRLLLLFWMMIAFYYFYVSYDYIQTEMNDERMANYAHYVVQLAGNETRTPREVRSLLIVKADELQIPLKPEQINVQGSGQNLQVSLQYDINIDVPIFQYGFYSKHYEHTVAYKQPR
jgi:hypothetical protein